MSGTSHLETDVTHRCHNKFSEPTFMFLLYIDHSKYFFQNGLLHQIAEIKMAGEGEKSQMLRELHVQKEFILSEQEREMENLKDVHKTEILALEARLRERTDKAEKVGDGPRVVCTRVY